MGYAAKAYIKTMFAALIVLPFILYSHFYLDVPENEMLAKEVSRLLDLVNDISLDKCEKCEIREIKEEIIKKKEEASYK